MHTYDTDSPGFSGGFGVSDGNAHTVIFKRTFIGLVQLIGGLGAGLAIITLLIAWQLHKGPVSLSFLTPYVERALNDGHRSFRLAIDDTTLTWAGWDRAIELRVKNVRAIDDSGAALSGRALLQGRLAPKFIELLGPEIRVRRETDGGLGIAVAAGGANNGDRFATGLLSWLIKKPERGSPMSYLETVRISGATMSFDDRMTGKNWQAPVGYLKLVRAPHGLLAEGSVQIEADDRIAEARTVAKHADAVIVCLGLTADLEGEESHPSNQFTGGDKESLDLPGRQQYLLEQVTEAAAGKPVILVLISGSALALGWADTHVNGILQAFYPGALGGQAIAEAIFGYISPSGKLPVTFYRSTDDLPDFRDYSMENRTYRYFKGETLYPFGFGLGYSTFALDNVTATRKYVSATLRNTGNMPAHQVVQVYVASPGQREIRSLAGMKRLFLTPGESAKVRIPLSRDAFSRWDEHGDSVEIPGTHTLHVGFTQPDERSVALYGQEPVKLEITV